MERFTVVILEQARQFLLTLDDKTRLKILFNIDKSKAANDPKLFKKLQENIWEFRSLYGKKQYRLFAFWDKSDHAATLVIATHGIIKKTGKVSPREIQKAQQIRNNYFEAKQK